MRALILCFLTLISQTALGAQEAIIISETAQVFDEPNDHSPLLEVRKKGERLLVSSNQKKGWFKTKTQRGIYGWIHQSQVSMHSEAPKIEASEVEFFEKEGLKREDYRSSAEEQRRAHSSENYHLRAGAGTFISIQPYFNSFMGFDSYEPFAGSNLFLEGAAKVTDFGLRAAVRISRYVGQHDILISGAKYNYYFSGLPVLIGANIDALKHGLFLLETGFYMGLSFFNAVTLTSTDFNPPKDVILEHWPFAALLNVAGKYKILRKVRLVGEAGLFYSHSEELQFNREMQGPLSPRDRSGRLKSLRLTQLAPIFNVGLEFTF